jgi:hypothetical protein
LQTLDQSMFPVLRQKTTGPLTCHRLAVAGFLGSLDLRPDRQCRRPHSGCPHPIFCKPNLRTSAHAFHWSAALSQTLRLAIVGVRAGSQNGAMVVLWRDGPRFIACVQGSGRVRREADMQAVVTHQRMVRARSTCCRATVMAAQPRCRGRGQVAEALCS